MKLGVCYYPEHWPEELWETDAKEMVALGLSIVRIGEFSWSKLEPQEGVYKFEWLDKAINTLHQNGLQIILGTPSATPPRWVIDKFPDLLARDKEGRPRKFGSRRHYCFSHDGYKNFSAKMAERLARRYGDHPAIMAWQIDNEYGCHDTSRSYSQLAKEAFRVWLKKKYESVDQLNERWGNVFWSMEYRDFNEVDLPNLSVTEANPIHVLDFYRFSSDQIIAWNRAQVEAIRIHSNRPVMHNYMGRITDFDHHTLGADLDFATWDSYPLGFLEDRSDRSSAYKDAHQLCGDSDFQAFHHDLYRGVGRGRWAIMEQQPGPVNWAPYNPAPLPGMVKLWTLEAFAHGAEFVAYFRWRQVTFAQEQLHTAIKAPDNFPSNAYHEIKELKEELANYEFETESKATIALVFDYESQWAWEVQPQGKSFDYFELVFDFYCSFRQLGVSIDILSSKLNNLNEYKLVCIPGLFSLSTKMLASLESFKGEILMGPRFNTKTTDFKIEMTSVSKLFGQKIRLTQVETLRPSTIRTIEGRKFKTWIEELEIEGKKLSTVYTSANKTYIGAWPEKETMIKIVSDALSRASIEHKRLPDNIRLSGGYRFDYKSASVS